MLHEDLETQNDTRFISFEFEMVVFSLILAQVDDFETCLVALVVQVNMNHVQYLRNAPAKLFLYDAGEDIDLASNDESRRLINQLRAEDHGAKFAVLHALNLPLILRQANLVLPDRDALGKDLLGHALVRVLGLLTCIGCGLIVLSRLFRQLHDLIFDQKLAAVARLVVLVDCKLLFPRHEEVLVFK